MKLVEKGCKTNDSELNQLFLPTDKALGHKAKKLGFKKIRLFPSFITILYISFSTFYKSTNLVFIEDLV